MQSDWCAECRCLQIFKPSPQAAESLHTLVQHTLIVRVAEDSLEAPLKRCLAILQLLGERRACTHEAVLTTTTGWDALQTALEDTAFHEALHCCTPVSPVP